MVRQHAGRSLTLPRGTAQPTVAGTGGDFTVDLKALAQNATGNNQLSAANGYRPGLNLPRRRPSARACPTRTRRALW